MNRRTICKLLDLALGERCREKLGVPCPVAGEEQLPVRGRKRALQEVGGMADRRRTRITMELHSAAGIAETLAFRRAPPSFSGSRIVKHSCSLSDRQASNCKYRIEDERLLSRVIWDCQVNFLCKC